MNRGCERGFTLLETSLAAAALAAVLLAFGATSLDRRPGSLAAARAALPALVARARTLAESTGDGATLALVPSGSGLVVTLYPHRPIPASAFDPTNVEFFERFGVFAASSAAGTAPFAIFLSSSGGASYAAWSSTSGLLAAEPACSAPLDLVVGTSASAVATAPVAMPSSPPAALAWFTLDCEDARLEQS